MANREYTRVEHPDDFEGARNIFSCNDCGAHGEDPREIKHHDTCVPGEGKKWEQFYEEANAEEDEHDGRW